MVTLTLKKVDARLIQTRRKHFKATGLRPEDVALALGARILYEAGGDCDLTYVKEGWSREMNIHLGVFRPKYPGQMEEAEDVELHYGNGSQQWQIDVARGIAQALDCLAEEAVVALMLLQIHAKENEWELRVRS